MYWVKDFWLSSMYLTMRSTKIATFEMSLKVSYAKFRNLDFPMALTIVHTSRRR